MSTELVLIPLYEKLIQLVCRTVSSPNSKLAYRKSLLGFFAFLGDRAITRDTVLEYREHMETKGLSASTVSLRLAAVRALVKEAQLWKAIDKDTEESILKIRGPARNQRRTGKWLTVDQAEKLIQTPPAETVRGRRDRAIIGTFIGTGIRCEELVCIKADQVQQRDGRWVIVDLVGKGNKLRTVPVPNWCKVLIDAQDDRPFLCTDDMLFGRALSRSAIRDLVTKHAYAAGLGKLGPHDLRRTFSKLAERGGARLHQIQLTLGHSSIETTERYLGSQQDLTNAPCDVLGIELP
jgi:site-specific recombinase XerD